MEKLLKNSIYTILCATILLGTTQSNSMNKWSRFKTYFIKKSKIGTSNFLKEQKESLRLDDQYKGICFKSCIIQEYFKRNNTKKYYKDKIKDCLDEVNYSQNEVKYYKDRVEDSQYFAKNLHQDKIKFYQDEVKIPQYKVKFYQDEVEIPQYKVKNSQNLVEYYKNRVKESQNQEKYYQDKVKYNQNKLNKIIKKNINLFNMDFLSYDQKKYFEI